MHRKTYLLQYHHGLGDVIQLTPHLRYLWMEGYKIDLMCRQEVVTTHLLEYCPYIHNFIIIKNPWQSHLGFSKQLQVNINYFDQLKLNYDASSISTHVGIDNMNKMVFTAQELGIDLKDFRPEIFISPAIHQEAKECVQTYFPGGFIFLHYHVEDHPVHSWDGTTYTTSHFPPLPIYDTNLEPRHPNINFAFAVLGMATHIILSSSVFVHAADAMNKPIDTLFYGKADDKVAPTQTQVLKKIIGRENA